MIFFFNDTATTEIYTLSLHDALPILGIQNAIAKVDKLKERPKPKEVRARGEKWAGWRSWASTYLWAGLDRKSTRLNSSHANISYAVFCLTKKKYSTVTN